MAQYKGGASGTKLSESLSRMGYGICRAGLLCLLVQLHAGAAASEGMPVAPGDILRVSIAGGPELGRESAKVGADGRIVLPGLDTIEVAGLDLDMVREQLEAVLVARELIRDPVVSVEVVSYRPFYVGGAVASPGAIAYEPGLTVRHALILAGGLDRSDGPEMLTVADLVDLKAKYEAINFALAEVRSRAARLQAELEDNDAPDFSGIVAEAHATVGETSIMSIDADLFRDRMTERSENRDHLWQAVALVDLEIDVLSKQMRLQEEEMAVQNSQLENARALVEKGLMPVVRLQEQEREASRLSRDLLDTQAYAARARQNKQSNLHEISAVETKRRIDLRDAIRDALLDLTRIEAEKDVISAALVSAGIVVMNAGSGAELEPQIVINRTANGATESIVAGMDAPVQPGDVLEVSIAPAGQG